MMRLPLWRGSLNMFKAISKLQTVLCSIKASELLASIVGAAIVLMAMHFVEPSPKKIATVNITGIVNQFVQSQAKRNLPPKELQQHVNAFGQELQATLNIIAQKHNVTLLVQEAVVAGAQDLTPIVKQQLANMQDQQNNKVWYEKDVGLK